MNHEIMPPIPKCSTCKKNPVQIEQNGYGGTYEREECSSCIQKAAGKKATELLRELKA